jgi:hypothetical protein
LQIISRSSQLNRRADTPLFTAHNFSVPIDHFHDEDKYEPHSNGTFSIRYYSCAESTALQLINYYRYWYDATYYKPGGPVIALASGETSGEDRLPYLQKGIVYQLAKATNGIGVILEHRYYGSSFPVPDLSIENMRFLTTEQAMADAAYLAENIVFEGLEDLDLTASDVPWIVYGGSYAGAFVVSSVVGLGYLVVVTHIASGLSSSSLPPHFLGSNLIVRCDTGHHRLLGIL